MSPPASSNDSCALLGLLAPEPLGWRTEEICASRALISYRCCHEAAAFVFTQRASQMLWTFSGCRLDVWR